MALFPSITLLMAAAAVFSVEAAVPVNLNGRNKATVTTAQHMCCNGHTTEVTTAVTAVLFDKNTKRTDFGGNFDKRMTELDKKPGDHKGHILASVLGGPAQLWNLAPQADNVNTKIRKQTTVLNTWHDCEKWIRTQLEKQTKLPITVKIKLTYGNHNCRPTLWSIEATNKDNTAGCHARDIHNGVDPHFGVCQRPRKG